MKALTVYSDSKQCNPRFPWLLLDARVWPYHPGLKPSIRCLQPGSCSPTKIQTNHFLPNQKDNLTPCNLCNSMWQRQPCHYSSSIYIAFSQCFKTRTGPTSRPGPGTGRGGGKNPLRNWPGETRSTRVRPGQFFSCHCRCLFSSFDLRIPAYCTCCLRSKTRVGGVPLKFTLFTFFSLAFTITPALLSVFFAINGVIIVISCFPCSCLV